MKLREIERLRAVAILMVMVMHWDAWQKLLPEVATHSVSGVDLFFVISGYVVTLSLVRLLPPLDAEATFVDAFERSKVALKTFYARRFFRILPAALAVFLLDRFLMTIFPQNFGTPREWFNEAVAFFGGVYNYAHAYHKEYRMGVYWSLAVEEHFYLVLPVVFVTFRTTSRRLAACATIAAVSIVSRALPHPDGVDVQYYEMFSSHLRFDSLMAGVALALVSAGKAATPSPIMPRWLMSLAILPACLALIWCLPGVTPEYVWRREGFIALWMLSGVVVGFASLDRGYVLSFPLVGRALEHVGSRSYALYLLHREVGRFEDDLGKQWPGYRAWIPQEVEHPWRRALVLFLAALLAAELLHKLVERPFMRIGHALVDPRRRASLRVSPRARALLASGAILFLLYYLRHPIMLALGPRDLALGMPVTLSSQYEDRPTGDQLVNGRLESFRGAVTNPQESPWATIDLGRPTRIGSIRIYNRADQDQDGEIPLELSVSNDNVTFTVVARRDVMFTQAFPWRIKFNEEPVRYLRVQVPRFAILCLSEVEVFEGRAMAGLP